MFLLIHRGLFGILKQESPPIGGAVRNATSPIGPIPTTTASITLAIACSENVNKTTQANYAIIRRAAMN